MSYLCVMIYLNTNTSDLSVHQIRSVVGEVVLWCEKNIGTKRKSHKLSYFITSRPICPFPAYGVYDPKPNVIKIHRGECYNVKKVIQTVIHEYTHFLQDLRSYSRVLNEVGYKDHPYEVEARNMENNYSICWKQIKNNI